MQSAQNVLHDTAVLKAFDLDFGIDAKDGRYFQSPAILTISTF
jgi:hypothetical protein